MRPIVLDYATEPELTSKTSGLDLDSGEDENVRHTSYAELDDSSVWRCSALRLSHASYDLPAAVSLPVK